MKKYRPRGSIALDILKALMDNERRTVAQLATDLQANSDQVRRGLVALQKARLVRMEFGERKPGRGVQPFLWSALVARRFDKHESRVQNSERPFLGESGKPSVEVGAYDDLTRL